MLGPSLWMKKKSTSLGVIYVLIYFFCCDFYLWHFYLIFCVLPFMFYILSSERFLSFIVLYCILIFCFLLLSLNFCILYFGWVSSCYFYDKKCLSVPLQIWQQTEIETDN